MFSGGNSSTPTQLFYTHSPVPSSYGTWRSPCRKARWTTGDTGVSQGSGRSRSINPVNGNRLTCSQEETHLLSPPFQFRGANGYGPLAGEQGSLLVFKRRSISAHLPFSLEELMDKEGGVPLQESKAIYWLLRRDPSWSRLTQSHSSPRS